MEQWRDQHKKKKLRAKYYNKNSSKVVGGGPGGGAAGALELQAAHAVAVHQQHAAAGPGMNSGHKNNAAGAPRAVQKSSLQAEEPHYPQVSTANPQNQVLVLASASYSSNGSTSHVGSPPAEWLGQVTTPKKETAQALSYIPPAAVLLDVAGDDQEGPPPSSNEKNQKAPRVPEEPKTPTTFLVEKLGEAASATMS
ncbi:unnamed protein product, partial [Amoebophrya sp. A25]|eukprot:GSA25T00008255001.1